MPRLPLIAAALMLSAPTLSVSVLAASPSTPAVFPTRVTPKYAKESAGQARMHTCLDQYNANKAGGANGGMNWIQKGGGYFSVCSKRLRAATGAP